MEMTFPDCRKKFADAVQQMMETQCDFPPYVIKECIKYALDKLDRFTNVFCANSESSLNEYDWYVDGSNDSVKLMYRHVYAESNQDKMPLVVIWLKPNGEDLVDILMRASGIADDERLYRLETSTRKK